MANFFSWLKNIRDCPRSIPELNQQGQTLSSLAEKVKALHFLSVVIGEDTKNLETLHRELVCTRSIQHVIDTSFREDA